MKTNAKEIKLNHGKLMGFRKVKAGGKNPLKPLSIAMVGSTKVGTTKV